MPNRMSAPILCLCLFAACGQQPAPQTDRAVVRDSAGIRIVENPGVLVRRPLGWAINTVPDLVVGKAQRNAPYELFNVRGVAKLPDGRIVVVNGGTEEIRFFDRHGIYLSTSGRAGDGPGEYRMPLLMQAPAYDTLCIYDLRLGRLTWLTPSGAVARSWSPATKFIGWPVGFVTHDAYVTTFNTAPSMYRSPAGMLTNRVVYLRVQVDPESRDTIADIAGRRMLMSRLAGGGVNFTPLPFDVAPGAAVGSGRLYIVPGRSRDVLVYDSVGRLERVFRIDTRAEPVSRGEYDREVDRLVARVRNANQAAQLRRRYDKMPRPATMPRFKRLVVDAAGELWLEIFRPEANPRHTWIVLDTSGQGLGRIDTPPGVDVQQIGGDFILGTVRDSLDVQRVVRYELLRRSGQVGG